PGGQLVQATDQWVGIRNARIVLIDSEGVRAPMVASWLKQLGCDVYVLQEGTRAKISVPRAAKPQLPELAAISAAELKGALDAGKCTVIDLRPRVASAAQRAVGTIVLAADDAGIARAAAIDIIEAGIKDVKMLVGGLKGW